MTDRDHRADQLNEQSHQSPLGVKPRRPTRARLKATTDEERVLGIDVESPLLVRAAVVVSLLLAEGLAPSHPGRACPRR